MKVDVAAATTAAVFGSSLHFARLGHSHPALALASGADLKTILTSLGHSTITTTANIYLLVVDSLQKAAAVYHYGNGGFAPLTIMFAPGLR